MSRLYAFRKGSQIRFDSGSDLTTCGKRSVLWKFTAIGSAQTARSAKKVMQFLSEGRFAANVVDGKVALYAGRGAAGRSGVFPVHCYSFRLFGLPPLSQPEQKHSLVSFHTATRSLNTRASSRMIFDARMFGISCGRGTALPSP